MKALLVVLMVCALPAAAGGPEPVSGALLDEWENGLGYVFPVVEHFPVQELSDDGSIFEV